MQEQILKKLDDLADTLQRSGMNDYVDYLSNTKRIIWVNLLAGLARGFGAAIGFTLLGAVVIYILQQASFESIPIIGEFIAEIVRIVQERL